MQRPRSLRASSAIKREGKVRSCKPGAQFYKPDSASQPVGDALGREDARCMPAAASHGDGLCQAEVRPSSPHQQVLLFRCRRATIAAEMWWLKCYPVNAQILKRLAQLRVNAHLLMLEVTRWMDRHAALILISAFCFLLSALGTGCSPAWQFHPGKPGGDW